MIKWAELVVLIFLSAFFSAAETALTTFNKIRMRERADQGNKSARLLLKMADEKPKMLSAILVGNNIVNIAASALATMIAMSIGFNVGMMTLLLTLIILIFGEITPKNAAAVKSEGLALFYSHIIYALMILLTPVIWLVNLICSGVLRLFGIDMHDSQTIMTEGELRTIVDVSHEDGVIESEEKEMINNVVDFGDARAKDIMTPRIDVVEVDIDATYDEVRSIFADERYTRIPVYKDDRDNIIGVINMKDFFMNEDREHFRTTDIMRDAYYTYETKRTSELLVEMQEESVPIAIVLNEYGASEGVVTMEDLIEEIVGEIRDEYDAEEEELIEEISEREYMVEASVKLDDLNDEIGTDLTSDDYDTVGGYIIGISDTIPQAGESFVDDGGITFEIVEGTKNRIDKVRILLSEKIRANKESKDGTVKD
ncbi:MAG: HlyC/CorC family transporter [Lachnospiraceae bacterium]|nr:HlyC/CorC family transporter [Lachnospiraceae bacterium]